MTVRACLARQVQADGVGAGTCFRCPLGQTVAQQVAPTVRVAAERVVA